MLAEMCWNETHNTRSVFTCPSHKFPTQSYLLKGISCAVFKFYLALGFAKGKPKKTTREWNWIKQISLCCLLVTADSAGVWTLYSKCFACENGDWLTGECEDDLVRVNWMSVWRRWIVCFEIMCRFIIAGRDTGKSKLHEWGRWDVGCGKWLAPFCSDFLKD